MFKNYLKIALRHIARNKSYLLINIIGLGLALACSIVAFVNYQYFNTADRFHEQSEKIFRVTVRNVGTSNATGNVVSPLVPRAVTDISQVTAGTRIDKKEVVVQIGEQVFPEVLTAVDPSFLEVFTYTIQSGDEKALENPSNIILTEKTAQKFFGDRNPIGQTLTIEPGQPWQKEFLVAAIIQDPPLGIWIG